MPAEKARQAGFLVHKLTSGTEEERLTAFHRLQGLYPELDLSYDPDAGLRIYCKEGPRVMIPRALQHEASHIEAVRPDGLARVIKSQMMMEGAIIASTRPRRPSPTCWERILENG